MKYIFLNIMFIIFSFFDISSTLCINKDKDLTAVLPEISKVDKQNSDGSLDISGINNSLDISGINNLYHSFYCKNSIESILSNIKNIYISKERYRDVRE